MESKQTSPAEQEHACFHSIEKAKNVARATWLCPECGEDVSILYVLFWKATHYDV